MLKFFEHRQKCVGHPYDEGVSFFYAFLRFYKIYWRILPCMCEWRLSHNRFRGGELNMKTRSEQPSFKQKADSRMQNNAENRMQNKTDSKMQNKADSRMSNCSLDNCTRDSQ